MEDAGYNSTSDRSTSDRLRASTAKWGAACGPCATAKAKCIRSNSELGSKCDRCDRLFKDCSDQIHRPRKKRQVRPSRTAQIEERLNGLVNLLKASGELSTAELATDTTCIPTETDPTVSDQNTPSESPAGSFQPSHNLWAVPETYNSHAPATCICRPQSGEAPPPPESDETLLNIYRDELQPVHPFVVVPTFISAAALKSTRPFLMSAIRMVASFRNLKSMRAQMYHLMKYLSDHMLIRSQKSLDLLLGIIVIAGWYQYHCFVHAQLNNLLSLAMALIGELALNRHPSVKERSILMMFKSVTPAARTNEERRALIGVWYLTSSVSINFNGIESMRYTNYIQECLQELEATEEYRTDPTLIYLARFQRVTERIYQLNSKDIALKEIPGIPTAPMSAYVSAFQNELDRIREDMPDHLKANNMFMTYFYTAMLRLYEPPVIDSALVTSISRSLTTTSSSAPSSLDQMYQSRNALVAWLDNWLNIPASLYCCQTTPLAAQLVYGLTMLGRWARLTTSRTTYTQKGTAPDNSSNKHPAMGNSLNTNSQASGTELSPSRLSLVAPNAIEHIETCAYAQVTYSRQGMDPKLPGAVAVLRTQLQQHPGLLIDVSQILTSFESRFEAASAMFQVSPMDNSKPEHSIWSMAAIKIRVTRAKLERWAAIVAQGPESLSLEETEDLGMEEARIANAGTSLDGSGDYPQDSMTPDQLSMQNYNEGMPWTSDMLQGGDPSLWLDGYLDWSTVIMNSMGTAEQGQGN